jgi:hypothetical protein
MQQQKLQSFQLAPSAKKIGATLALEISPVGIVEMVPPDKRYMEAVKRDSVV